VVPRLGVFVMATAKHDEDPPGLLKVSVRYRKVRGNSGRILDAHDYGYKAWTFYVKKK